MAIPPRAELSSFQQRKRTAILEGARRVFLVSGFGSATMDDVAAAAGVGKQTLYRHFGSKEALFLGLVETMCAEAARTAGAGEAADAQTVSVEDELRAFGRLFATELTTPDSLRFYRAIVAESERLPELGALFYENGPQLARRIAARILRRQFDEKTASLRASTFISVLLGDAHLELTLGYAPTSLKARLEKQLEEAMQAALR
jgi:TetR/AcrR family transcriptional repressor of mexJK operon